MKYNQNNKGLSPRQKYIKRSFDIILSIIGLGLFWWVIMICFVLSSIDTRKNGFFTQKRVGKHGRCFKVIKLRTMRDSVGINTTVTTKDDVRITLLGSIFRKFKLDELPQLINVLLGHMSFVGPRPDVPGYADKLQGDDLLVLSVAPGITGPATLKYRNEEEILSLQPNPIQYNEEVIFPDKVKINRSYVEEYSFFKDIRYILQTVLPFL